MRIRKIEFSNHPILGDLSLDLTLEGESVPTIILAGENGTGKTALLNAMYFLAGGRSQFGSKETRKYELEVDPNDLHHWNDYFPVAPDEEHSYTSNLVVVEVGSPDDRNRLPTSFTTEISHEPKTANVSIQVDRMRLAFRALYSNVGVNYSSRTVNATTSLDIDLSEESKASQQGDSDEIAQLLVDIDTLDAHDFRFAARESGSGRYDPESDGVRMRRFAEAFGSIFSDKEFYGVTHDGNSKKVMFKSGEKLIEINELSSGEKQIVFRGGFFLRDQGIEKSTLYLVDEPEISLHPNWQMNILEYYQDICKVDGEASTSQLVVATHSPFLLHSENRANDKVVVLRRNEENAIECVDPEFYGWTDNQAVAEAFKIQVPEVQVNEVFIYLEGTSDVTYLEYAAQLYDHPIQNASFLSVGESNKNGVTGCTGLDKALKNFRSNPEPVKGKVIFLYDSDCNKPDEDLHPFYVRSLPPQNDAFFPGGVENFLCIPDDFDADQFKDTYKEEVTPFKTSVQKSLSKTRLAEHLTDGKHDQVFLNFEKFLDELHALASG